MNILFVSSTRIGDAVLTTGLLADLVERHADARVTLDPWSFGYYVAASV